VKGGVGRKDRYIYSSSGDVLVELVSFISNNSSFRLKHPGVPDGSDGSGGTLYHLMENQT
jgi:hypothetical protein